MKPDTSARVAAIEIAADSAKSTKNPDIPPSQQPLTPNIDPLSKGKSSFHQSYTSNGQDVETWVTFLNYEAPTILSTDPIMIDHLVQRGYFEGYTLTSAIVSYLGKALKKEEKISPTKRTNTGVFLYRLMEAVIEMREIECLIPLGHAGRKEQNLFKQTLLRIFSDHFRKINKFPERLTINTDLFGIWATSRTLIGDHTFGNTDETHPHHFTREDQALRDDSIDVGQYQLVPHEACASKELVKEIHQWCKQDKQTAIYPPIKPRAIDAHPHDHTSEFEKTMIAYLGQNRCNEDQAPSQDSNIIALTHERMLDEVTWIIPRLFVLAASISLIILVPQIALITQVASLLTINNTLASWLIVITTNVFYALLEKILRSNWQTINFQDARNGLSFILCLSLCIFPAHPILSFIHLQLGTDPLFSLIIAAILTITSLSLSFSLIEALWHRITESKHNPAPTPSQQIEKEINNYQPKHPLITSKTRRVLTWMANNQRHTTFYLCLLFGWILLFSLWPAATQVMLTMATHLNISFVAAATLLTAALFVTMIKIGNYLIPTRPPPIPHAAPQPSETKYLDKDPERYRLLYVNDNSLATNPVSRLWKAVIDGLWGFFYLHGMKNPISMLLIFSLFSITAWDIISPYGILPPMLHQGNFLIASHFINPYLALTLCGISMGLNWVNLSLLSSNFINQGNQSWIAQAMRFVEENFLDVGFTIAILVYAGFVLSGIPFFFHHAGTWYLATLIIFTIKPFFAHT